MNLTEYINQAVEVSKLAQKQPGNDPDLLVRKYLLLPISAARQVARKRNMARADHAQLLQDLIGAGNVALLEAANTFRPERGSFGAYAKMLVIRAINKAALQWTSGGVLKEYTDYYPVKDAATKLRKAGQQVTPEAVSEMLGIPVSTVRALLNVTNAAFCLDAPIPGNDDGAPFLDTLADGVTSPEEQALASITADERYELIRAARMLPPRYTTALGLTTGVRTFDSVDIGTLMRSSVYGVQLAARGAARKLFQGGEANARRLGYEPNEATGPPRGSGTIPVPTSANRKSTRTQRDNPADIWRRVADRWRQPEVDTG